MTYIDNTNSKPVKNKVSRNIEMCISWDNEKCGHPAYKGSDCSKDPECIVFVRNNIPRCIDCKELIKSVLSWDKDKCGPFCLTCFNRLPKDLKGDES